MAKFRLGVSKNIARVRYSRTKNIWATMCVTELREKLRELPGERSRAMQFSARGLPPRPRSPLPVTR
jgi:hypothetical protein